MTYEELLSEVAGWSNRTDLAPRLPMFVRLAEARMSADIHSKALEQTQTLTLESGAVELPTNIIDVIGLRVGGRDVEITSRETLGQGRACLNGRVLEMPGMDGDIEVRAKCAVPALAENGSNVVSETFPNVYLFGVLMEVYDYLRDDEQVLKYHKRYTEAVSQISGAFEYHGTQSGAYVRWAP